MGVSIRQVAGRTERKRVQWSDIRLIVTLPAYLLLSLIAPQRHWPRICRWLGGSQRNNPLVAKVAASLPAHFGQWTPDRIVSALAYGRTEHYLQILRDYGPGGWRPACRIEGIEHLQDALAEGKGALLWIDHFVFNGLIPKLALELEGHPFYHVSRPEHGFSKTRFGIRFLNPVRARIENRYLAGRLLIDRGRKTRVARDVLRRLRANKIVSITAGAWEGGKIADVPLLDSLYPLATGAVGFARSSGAPLIPVAVVREPDTGLFRVVLEPPLNSGDETVEALFEAYAKRLEPWIEGYADQWRGWTYLKPVDGKRADDGGA